MNVFPFYSFTRLTVPGHKGRVGVPCVHPRRPARRSVFTTQPRETHTSGQKVMARLAVHNGRHHRKVTSPYLFIPDIFDSELTRRQTEVEEDQRLCQGWATLKLHLWPRRKVFLRWILEETCISPLCLMCSCVSHPKRHIQSSVCYCICVCFFFSAWSASNTNKFLLLLRPRVRESQSQEGFQNRR